MSKLEKGDFVKLTYEHPERGTTDEHKGEVLEVDTDDPSGIGCELFAKITDGDRNTEIHYFEGEFEGEPFAQVYRHSEFSGDHHIGENAECEVFG